jgi:flagellar hook assembly protein FlgD
MAHVNKDTQFLPAGSSNPLSKSPIKSSSFSEFFDGMQADRKTRTQIEGADITKAQQNIDNAIEFSTKLMLAAAKNMGFPDNDGSSNKSKEMADAANSIAGMMATKASIGAQMAAIESQKNPAVDLMSLKDKVVDYRDDTKSFFGEPVKYNYKVSHNEPSPSVVVNLTFSVLDKNGISVKTVRQTGKTGEHEFIWDGKNNSGQMMLPGSYTLSLKAEGSKTVGGTQVTFPVKAGAVLSGVVESVKFEKGTAIGVMIDGKLIKRDQITDVKDVIKPKENNYLTPDLIGKRVEMNFSRVQVKDGSLDVYFNNHVENPGKITVKIYDESNKYIKTLESSDQIGVGIGKLSLPNHGLENGNYNIKFYVADVRDEAKPVDVELDYKTKLLVAGINSHAGTFMSIEEDLYSPHNIDSIVGNYLTPLQQRRQEYLGAQVTYRDDFFKYSVVAEPKTFTMMKPQEDGIISYGQMTIYDPATSELVATVKGRYNLFDLLDDNSKRTVNTYLEENYRELGSPEIRYNDLNEQQIVEVNRKIEVELTANRMTLQEKYKQDYDNGKVPIAFPAWNGQLSNNIVAPAGKEYRREFTPIYVKPDNTTFSGQTKYEEMIDRVEYVDEVGGKLSLKLVGGQTIPEELVTNVEKPS